MQMIACIWDLAYRSKHSSEGRRYFVVLWRQDRWHSLCRSVWHFQVMSLLVAAVFGVPVWSGTYSHSSFCSAGSLNVAQALLPLLLMALILCWQTSRCLSITTTVMHLHMYVCVCVRRYPGRILHVHSLAPTFNWSTAIPSDSNCTAFLMQNDKRRSNCHPAQPPPPNHDL